MSTLIHEGLLLSPLREKFGALRHRVADAGSALVAYSGGVDSALVAFVAQRELGDRALAVTADSAAVPRAQIEDARRFAAEFGLRHEIIATAELEDPGYRDNAASRCFFFKAELYGKMANLFADVPSEKIVSTGEFKMLVSGDPIGAERKHQQRLSFENYAKLIFSANEIPRSDDKSYAYFRRWVIIPFPRVFEGDEADEHLMEKLTTPQELSGILNLALKGLAKLKTDRGFKEVDPEEIRRAYELGASRIRTFLQERCIVEAGNESLFEESAVLREAYRHYCREQGTRYYDERKFGEELKALGIAHKQKRSGGKNRSWCDFGISLKTGRLNVTDKSLTSWCNRKNIQKEIVADSPVTLSRAPQEAPAT